MGNPFVVLVFLVVVWHVPFASAIPRPTDTPEPLVDVAPENDCRCWAAQGQCGANPVFMAKKCKASCMKHQTSENCTEKLPKLQSRVSDLGAQIQKLKAESVREKAEKGAATVQAQKLTSQITALEAQLQQKADNGNADVEGTGAVCSNAAESASVEKMQELKAYIGELEGQLQQKISEAAALSPAAPATAATDSAAANKIQALSQHISDLESQLQLKDRERKTEVDQLRVAAFHAETAKQDATKQSQALKAQIVDLESEVEKQTQQRQSELDQVRADAGAAEKLAAEKIQALSARVSDCDVKLKQKVDEAQAHQLRAEELHAQRRDETATDTIRKLTAQISDMKVQLNRKGDDRQEEIEQLKVKVMRAGVAAQDVAEKTQENEQLRAEAMRAKMGRQADEKRITTLTVKIAELESSMREKSAEKQKEVDQVKAEASRAESAEQAAALKIQELTKKVTEFEAQIHKDANNSKCDDKPVQLDAAGEALQLRIRELEVQLLAQTAAYYQRSELNGGNATFDAGGDAWYALYEGLQNLPSNISQWISDLPANTKHFIRAASLAIMRSAASAAAQAWEEMKSTAISTWTATTEAFSEFLIASKAAGVRAVNSAEELLKVSLEAVRSATFRAAKSAQEIALHPCTQAFFVISMMSITLIWWLRFLRSCNARVLSDSASGKPHVGSVPTGERRRQRRAMQEVRTMQVLANSQIFQAEEVQMLLQPSGESEGSDARHLLDTQVEQQSAPAEVKQRARRTEGASQELAAKLDKMNERILQAEQAEQVEQVDAFGKAQTQALAVELEAPQELQDTHAFQQQMVALKAAQALVDAALVRMDMLCSEFQAAKKEAVEAAARSPGEEVEAPELTPEAAVSTASEVEEAKEQAVENEMILPGAATATASATEELLAGFPLPLPTPAPMPPMAESAKAVDKIVQDEMDEKPAADKAAAEARAAAVDKVAMDNAEEAEEEVVAEVTEKAAAKDMDEIAANHVVEESVASEFVESKQTDREAAYSLVSTKAHTSDNSVLNRLRGSYYAACCLACICMLIPFTIGMAYLGKHGHLNTSYEAFQHLWTNLSQQTISCQRAVGNATAGLAVGMVTVSASGVQRIWTTCEMVKSNFFFAINHAWMTLALAGNNSHVKMVVTVLESVVAIYWLKWLRSFLAIVQIQSCAKHIPKSEDTTLDKLSLQCPVFDIASEHIDGDASVLQHREVKPRRRHCFFGIACACFACVVCPMLMFPALRSSIFLYINIWVQGLSRLSDSVSYQIGAFVVTVATNLSAKQLVISCEQVWSMIVQAASQSWMVAAIALLQFVPCIVGVVAAIAWLKWRKSPSACATDVDLATFHQEDSLSQSAPIAVTSGGASCPVFDIALDESEDAALFPDQQESAELLSLEEKPWVGSLTRIFRRAGIYFAYAACICLACFLCLFCLACVFLLCAWLHVHGFLAMEPYYNAFEWMSDSLLTEFTVFAQSMSKLYACIINHLQSIAIGTGLDQGQEDLKTVAREVCGQVVSKMIAACCGVIGAIRCLKFLRRTVASAQFRSAVKIEATPIAAPTKKVLELDPEFQMMEKPWSLKNVHELAESIRYQPPELDVDTFVFHSLQA